MSMVLNMPQNFGQPFLRLQASGPLYVSEAWSCTLSFSGGTIPTPTQAMADGAGEAFRRLIQDSEGPLIANRAGLATVKLARIGADGLYVDPRPVSWVSPDVGGSRGQSGTNVPPQIALAVTLEGSNPRGPAGRGRFYLPVPAGALQTDGRLTEAYAAHAAHLSAAMIREAEAAIGLQAYIVGAATAKGRGPARQQVAQVSVGRVLDTIRSRRTSLPEERVYDGPFGGGDGDF